MKIRKQDTVVIISGQDKNKKGKVIQTFVDKQKVAVENVNLKKKNVKPKKSGEKGQIVQFPAPIDVSNVMIVCSKCLKPTRIKTERKDKNRLRICTKCKKEI